MLPEKVKGWPIFLAMATFSLVFLVICYTSLHDIWKETGRVQPFGKMPLGLEWGFVSLSIWVLAAFHLFCLWLGFKWLGSARKK